MNKTHKYFRYWKIFIKYLQKVSYLWYNYIINNLFFFLKKMCHNPAEDFNSPAKIQARQEASEKERKKLENDFSKNVDNSLIKNTNKLWPKDKKDITSRLVTEYWKDKEWFNLIDSLKTILLDETLSLTVWPQSPKKWENFQDLKKRVIEFKNDL